MQQHARDGRLLSPISNNIVALGACISNGPALMAAALYVSCRCNATLQHLLKLAGRASEAEACLERQELLDLALEAVQRELDQC